MKFEGFCEELEEPIYAASQYLSVMQDNWGGESEARERALDDVKFGDHSWGLTIAVVRHELEDAVDTGKLTQAEEELATRLIENFEILSLVKALSENDNGWLNSVISDVGTIGRACESRSLYSSNFP